MKELKFLMFSLLRLTDTDNILLLPEGRGNGEVEEDKGEDKYR